MTNTELVPTGNDLVIASDRAAALQRLEEAATNSTTPEEALTVMRSARAVSDLLASMKEPFEDAWSAGKSSVTAARRCGRMLSEISARPVYQGVGRGLKLSPRGVVGRELGVSKSYLTDLVRLGTAPDPPFQRYIQDKSRIPSFNGALRACATRPCEVNRYQSNKNDWSTDRRRKAGVRTPANPSLDEAYSLIVRALGHLSGSPLTGPGGPKRLTAISVAMNALYQAEDALKPYRAGYDGTGRKAA